MGRHWYIVACNQSCLGNCPVTVSRLAISVKKRRATELLDPRSERTREHSGDRSSDDTSERRRREAGCAVAALICGTSRVRAARASDRARVARTVASRRVRAGVRAILGNVDGGRLGVQVVQIDVQATADRLKLSDVCHVSITLHRMIGYPITNLERRLVREGSIEHVANSKVDSDLVQIVRKDDETDINRSG